MGFVIKLFLYMYHFYRSNRNIYRLYCTAGMNFVYLVFCISQCFQSVLYKRFGAILYNMSITWAVLEKRKNCWIWLYIFYTLYKYTIRMEFQTAYLIWTLRVGGIRRWPSTSPTVLFSSEQMSDIFIGLQLGSMRSPT